MRTMQEGKESEIQRLPYQQASLDFLFPTLIMGRILKISSSQTLNFSRASAYQVALGTGDNSLKFTNARAGQRVKVKLVQPSGGDGNVDWPSTVQWQSGQQPALKTTDGAVDILEFVFDGTNYYDTGGATSRVPAAVRDVGLTTMVAAGVTALTLAITGGNAETDPAAITNTIGALRVCTGSGFTASGAAQCPRLMAYYNASGSIMLSSTGAGIGVGIDNLATTSKYTSGDWYVNNEGEQTGSSATISGTVQAGTLTGDTLGVSGGDFAVAAAGRVTRRPTSQIAMTATGGKASSEYAICTFSNTTSQRWLVRDLIMNVTTAPSPATHVDAGKAADASTSGSNLYNNLVLSSGVHSIMVDGAGSGKFLILDATGGTNDTINVFAMTGTGQGLVGECLLDYVVID